MKLHSGSPLYLSITALFLGVYLVLNTTYIVFAQVSQSNTFQVLGLAFIAMLGASIASTVTSVLAYLKSRDNNEIIKNTHNEIKEDKKLTLKNNEDIKNVASKQEEMIKRTDGRLDALLIAVRQSAHAEGMAKGIKDEQDRVFTKEAKIAKEKLVNEAEIAKNKLENNDESK